ncbi:ABC transporter ATP-binding protein [Shimia sp. R9_2]|uniref:ABC transporter ATP-binding protein n=1 Tax=Shimia sp. R9_2 TaxID=2821112 RepID=UPI001ADCF209|nr:ABC transporter ATP-binding protein [Shimia sp. R9_2]MBO9396755.1 ABC transporter ATP-binding protein [Shimia sp. R9_2]
MGTHLQQETKNTSLGTALLELTDLTLRFAGQENDVVQGVNLRVSRGEVLCLVGESGCGKSVTSMALMGLLSKKNTQISSGFLSISEGGWELPSEELPAEMRGNTVSMIFQEPMTSLNPAFRIGDQIAEVVQRHRGGSREGALGHAKEMLGRVGIANPEQRLHEYPHQLSGGMRQRVMIAMALANDPKVLIADEPTTALDVTIQAQILELIRDLRDETGMGTVMITHDLGVVGEIADTVAVMYAGQVVEQGPVRDVFDDPQHPYTIGLMSAMPRMDRPGEQLAIVPGTVPTISQMPEGCRFRTRCAFAAETCVERPVLTELGGGHSVACQFAPLEDHVAVSS